jgi:hypothetical protein
MAGKLAPSLKNLFSEIDAVWPRRDRRTDGWYASPSVRKTKGHNPGHNGYSHAIDVDRDGINPTLLINRIKKDGGILWYVIWSRTLYSNTYGWKPRPYTGKNPHTDHLHIEIYQTDKAESYRGRWGVDLGRNIPPDGSPPPPPPVEIPNSDVLFQPNYDGRDYSGQFSGLGASFQSIGGLLDAQGRAIKSIRR